MNVWLRAAPLSFQKRYLDLVQPLAIARDYPVTGVGLDRDYFQKLRFRFQMEDNFGKIIQTYTGFERISESTEKGSSNSLTYLMAAMGFPVAFFLFYCLLKQELFTKRKGIFIRQNSLDIPTFHNFPLTHLVIALKYSWFH